MIIHYLNASGQVLTLRTERIEGILSEGEDGNGKIFMEF